MNLTRVVNMHREPCDVVCDRTSIFGNPFHVGAQHTRLDAIQKYREYFYTRLEADPEFRSAVKALCGKRLGCHCLPKPCHASVIANWCNEEIIREREYVRSDDLVEGQVDRRGCE